MPPIIPEDLPDPLLLYRVLISIVLGGIWLYTVIETLIALWPALARSRRGKTAKYAAANDASEAALASSLPTSALLDDSARPGLRSLPSFRKETDALMRILRKQLLLLVLQQCSWHGVRRMWRLYASILLLLIADAFAIYALWTL